MLRLVVTRSTALRSTAASASFSRALATSASSRVKILGSDAAYTQIATVRPLRVSAGVLALSKASFAVDTRDLQRCSEGSGRKSIVYFTAKWCPPCKMISPIYDELSAKYPEIEFAKVDVDELNDTTSKAGVRSMPTFFAFNDGKLQRELSFSGADEALLRDNINQLNEL